MPAKPDEQLPVSQGARGLKPCPFCGGEARADTGSATAWVQCETPGCDSHQMHDTIEQAITAWNQRAGEREPAPSSERIPNALWPFIQHDKDCVLRGHWMEAAEHDCDCGLAEALATTQEPALDPRDEEQPEITDDQWEAIKRAAPQPEGELTPIPALDLRTQGEA